MKTFLVLVSFLFMTVCYAAPPPNLVSVAADEVAYMADINKVVEISVQETDAQEVAFIYIGYTFSPSGKAIIEENSASWEEEKPALLSTFLMEESNKPPLLYLAGNSALNRKTNFLINSQHSNYGYPFTAK